MKINSFNVLFFIKWKIHAILTLLGNLDLPTFGNNMIDPFGQNSIDHLAHLLL